MEERVVKFTPKNVTLYILGFFVTSLGVIFLLRSQLGAGAWDTVTANLNAYLNSVNLSLTLGQTSMLITFTIFMFVLIYNRKLKLLFMLVPILLMGSVIDFWDILIFQGFYPELLIIKLLFFVLGALFIPLGLSMILNSSFPAFVFDEWTLVIMKIFKTNSITKARLGIEILGISLGVMFGFMAGIGFGAVNIGSIIMAVILPPIFNFFVNNIKKIDDKYFAIPYIIIVYFLGAVSIATGVNFMLRSLLGTSTWDTLHYALHQLINIDIGIATIVVAIVVTIIVIILNRNFKYLFMLLPIFGVGFLIDFINEDILVDVVATGLLSKVGYYLIGLFSLTLGGSLLIISGLPAGVFDELNLALMRVFKTNNFVKVRVIMEVTAVLTALFLGFLANDPIGMINIGTIIFSLTVGIIIKTYLTLFERIGLYNPELNT